MSAASSSGTSCPGGASNRDGGADGDGAGGAVRGGGVARDGKESSLAKPAAVTEDSLAIVAATSLAQVWKANPESSHQFTSGFGGC